MPVPYAKLEVGKTYKVIHKKMGFVTTGVLTKKYDEGATKYSEGGPEVEIDGGEYDIESYDFKLANPPPASGPGFRAARALLEGRGRTRKHKRRSRKTRRARK